MFPHIILFPIHYQKLFLGIYIFVWLPSVVCSAWHLLYVYIAFVCFGCSDVYCSFCVLVQCVYCVCVLMCVYWFCVFWLFWCVLLLCFSVLMCVYCFQPFIPNCFPRTMARQPNQTIAKSIFDLIKLLIGPRALIHPSFQLNPSVVIAKSRFLSFPKV